MNLVLGLGFGVVALAIMRVASALERLAAVKEWEAENGESSR